MATTLARLERAHGTRAKYSGDRCRCFACRVANTNYETERQARRRARRPWCLEFIQERREYLLRNSLTGEYDERFPESEWAAAYEKRESLNALEETLSETPPLWADSKTVGQVRRHLRTLKGAGLGLRRISELTGVSRSRLMEIRNRRSYNAARPRQRWLKLETAERILDLLPEPSLPAGAAIVSGRETWRLIEELLVAGFSRAAVARGMGLKSPALQFGKKRVLKRTENAVRAFHDRVWRSNTPAAARLRNVCKCKEWQR